MSRGTAWWDKGVKLPIKHRNSPWYNEMCVVFTDFQGCGTRDLIGFE